MNMMSSEHLGDIKEVYINNMLVKSLRDANQILDLEQ